MTSCPAPLPPEEVFALADIAELAGRRVDRLSGGQLQRVRFATALAGGPEVIVLDGPTAALDVEARREFWTGLRSFAERGRTILFSTHYLDKADEHADRVVVIARGRVIADGTSADIKRLVGGGTVAIDLAGRPSAGLERLPGVVGLELRGERARLRSLDPDATVLALAQAGMVRNLEVGGAAFNNGTGVAEDAAAGWLRQLLVTPLTPAQVVIARAVVGMLVVLPAVLVVLAAGAIFHGAQLSPGQWLSGALLVSRSDRMSSRRSSALTSGSSAQSGTTSGIMAVEDLGSLVGFGDLQQIQRIVQAGGHGLPVAPVQRDDRAHGGTGQTRHMRGPSVEPGPGHHPRQQAGMLHAVKSGELGVGEGREPGQHQLGVLAGHVSERACRGERGDDEGLPNTVVVLHEADEVGVAASDLGEYADVEDQGAGTWSLTRRHLDALGLGLSGDVAAHALDTVRVGLAGALAQEVESLLFAAAGGHGLVEGC